MKQRNIPVLEAADSRCDSATEASDSVDTYCFTRYQFLQTDPESYSRLASAASAAPQTIFFCPQPRSHQAWADAVPWHSNLCTSGWAFRSHAHADRRSLLHVSQPLTHTCRGHHPPGLLCHLFRATLVVDSPAVSLLYRAVVLAFDALHSAPSQSIREKTAGKLRAVRDTTPKAQAKVHSCDGNGRGQSKPGKTPSPTL